MTSQAGPPRPLLLGADVGGSRTRVLVTTAEGVVVGRGEAAGGNPVSRPDTAAAAFADAVGTALAGHHAGDVTAAVVGMAGGNALRDASRRRPFDEAWRRAGLRCGLDVRSDLEVAYASVAAEPDGAVLVAGTGAVAGRIEGWRLAVSADGLGWLLGDGGSGFWLGREAMRAAVDPAHGDQPGRLVHAVWRRYDVHRLEPAEARHRLLIDAYEGPPVRLAALAPLVLAAYADADPLAVALVAEAVALLGRALAAVLPEDGGPVVLAGGLLRTGGPVADGVRRLLAEREVDAVTAGDEVAGAVALARLAASARA